MHRTKEKFRPVSEELGDWLFVSLHTEKNECLLLLIGNVWLRMLPKPIDSYEYHIRIKPSYRGGDAAYFVQNTACLVSKDSSGMCDPRCRHRQQTVVNTASSILYPLNWVIWAGGWERRGICGSRLGERSKLPSSPTTLLSVVEVILYRRLWASESQSVLVSIIQIIQQTLSYITSWRDKASRF